MPDGRAGRQPVARSKCIICGEREATTPLLKVVTRFGIALVGCIVQRWEDDQDYHTAKKAGPVPTATPVDDETETELRAAWGDR